MFNNYTFKNAIYGIQYYSASACTALITRIDLELDIAKEIKGGALYSWIRSTHVHKLCLLRVYVTIRKEDGPGILKGEVSLLVASFSISCTCNICPLLIELESFQWRHKGGACGFIQPTQQCTPSLCRCRSVYLPKPIKVLTHCMHFYYTVVVTSMPVNIHGLSTWNNTS